MSISNSILLSLNLKDPKLTFFPNFVHERFFRGSLSLIYEARLSYDPPHVCPCFRLLYNSIFCSLVIFVIIKMNLLYWTVQIMGFISLFYNTFLKQTIRERFKFCVKLKGEEAESKNRFF